MFKIKRKFYKLKNIKSAVLQVWFVISLAPSYCMHVHTWPEYARRSNILQNFAKILKRKGWTFYANFLLDLHEKYCFILFRFCVKLSHNNLIFSSCVLTWIVDVFSTRMCYESRNCYQNATMKWIREMFENAKPCIVVKMVRIWMTSHSFDFRKEINHNIYNSRHAYQIVRNCFFIDVCTRDRSSFKNVDLNICADAWHSVSVMGL